MDPFLRACGADGPLRLLVECQGFADGEFRVFEQPFVLIGREPVSDLVLPHSDVERRHAYLQLVAGRLFCKDLGSRTGTAFDGRNHRLGWLDPGRTVRVGPYRIRLPETERSESPDGPPTDDRPRAARDPSRPQLTVELSHRSIRRALCPIEEDLVLVGTAADCQVRLIDPSVSNYHAGLVSTPSGVWVVDLFGQGGLMVNGSEARFARVYEGDEIRVGHSTLRLRYELPATAPSPTPEVIPGGLPATLTPPPIELNLAPFLEGRPPHEVNLVESIVGPLVGQFSLMQQQMMEQFHQAGMSMIQTYASYHRDQLQDLREEIEQIRGLNEELETLRAQLAFHAPGLLPAGRPGIASSQPRLGFVKLAPTGNGDGVAAIPLTSGRPEDPEGATHVILDDGQPIPPEPAIVATREIREFRDLAPGFADSDGDQPGFDDVGPAREDDEAIHTLLCRRITMIQEEQQGRWRKILRLVPTPLQKKTPV